MIEAKYLLQAFAKREKWEGYSVEPAGSAREKAIQNAVSSYARNVKREEVVLLCDAAIVGAGKKGFLFTEKALYGTIGDLKKRPVSLEGITGVGKGKRDGYLEFYYEDGTFVERYCSISASDIEFIIREAAALKRKEEGLTTDSTDTQKRQPTIGSQPEPQPQAAESNIITLTGEDGTEFQFEFLDLISYQNKDYVVLLPPDDGSDDGEVVILRVEAQDDDYEKYLSVESEEVLTAVFELFRKRFQDEFTFSDEQKKNATIYDMAPVPYDGDGPYIFISYSHKDSGEVWPIISRMQADGYRVWYDEGIDPGSEWDDNIASHIEKCSCLMAFISQNYLNSENCRDELSFARDLSLNRLLVYLEDVVLPGGMAMRLNRLQAVYYCRYNIKELFYRKLYASGVMLPLAPEN